MLANHTSRYHVAEAALRAGGRRNARVQVDAHPLIAHVQHLAQTDRKYIYETGAGTYPLAMPLTCALMGSRSGRLL
jgi:xylulose-5-phosphate/fructose-6-phosphate phosphoketolase